jgi:plastocyanin
MKRLLTCLLIFLSLSSNAQSGLTDGSGYAPNFATTDLNGNSHDLYNYLDSGYVVVLEFLSVTCGHCMMHAAGTENSYLTNGPSGNNSAKFLALEVNGSTDSTAVVNFAINYNVTFPIANDISPTFIDYEMNYTPTYYVIYPDRSYTTICANCVTPTSSSTIEGLLDNAIASWPPVYGCTDATAINYDSTATSDDGSCTFTSYIIKTHGMTFSPDTVLCNVGDTINFILGQSHNAVEVDQSTFLSGGNTSNGGFSFGYGSSGMYIPASSQTFYYVCQPHVSAGMVGVIIANINGCTDIAAVNYDATATVDDGSCTYCLFNQVSLNLFDSWGDGWSGAIMTVGGVDYTLLTGAVDSFNLCIDMSGCTDLIYTPGSFFANIENSWNITDTSGAILASGPDASGQLGNGCGVYGCTDPFALNYDSLATVDNGSCCGLQLDWEKIAQDIDGEASVDASGRAISFNSAGDIVAVGARWNDGNGTDAGHVRVYQNIGNSWIQLGQDIDGENTDDFSGHSLAINGEGDRVAIGAYGNDDNGTNAGQVRVYEYNGSTWIQLGQDIDGELANDFKGFQVDINQIGDKIVVGSYGNDDNGINAGKTQVYYFDGNTWIQFGSNIYGENPNDATGKSLQISGLSNIIAIGAASNADNGTNSGQVRVFEFYNGDWVQMGQDINGESNGDFSGAAISLNNSGNIIAIGAKRNDGNGSNAGHVRVFKYAANSWVQIGQDIDGLSTGDESGYSLSLNGLGNKIAIGSYLNSDSLTESGHVRVFYFDATSWKQIGNDIYGEFPNDWSGRSVALNEIGDKLAIGADLNDGNGAHSGHVRVFSYNTSCLQGCTDIAATNYDSTAIIDDGSCFIYGCTGPTYCNYDANATMDDGSCVGLAGCMDPLYNEYNSIANCDDGSCFTLIVNNSCVASPITGLFISSILDDRAVANFDNMNTYDASGAQICRVDQIRIKYREVGTSSWSQKNIASPTGYDAITGICNSTQKTDKNIYNLNPATEYQWQVKLWYCFTGATGWTFGPNFTTLGECPNVGNLSAYGANPNKATFNWDDSNGGYEFVRIKMRVDSISNATASDWFNVGGAGVSYPTFTKNKSGLFPGETYRGQARTWCDPQGGAYNSLGWTPLITWTQPTSNRIDGADAISNLDIYPNPSRDIFNVSFTSEDVQDLKVRILNLIGEEIINYNLEQFIGEYTKQIDLTNNAKGIYFLEIETNDGVVNKKLILQ